MILRALLSATAATVAFLLIYIQPAITTYLLPGTGGHPYLWHGAQVIFLLILTSGYWLAGRVGGWMSLRVLGACLIGLALLAAIPLDWIPFAPGSVWGAVAFVAIATGPGFLALSMASVGTQVAFVRMFEGRDPYWLYAASNAGSLLAAWSYVFLVEPYVNLSTQVVAWKVTVVVLFLAIGTVLATKKSGPDNRGLTPNSRGLTPIASRPRFFAWLMAGLCPVALSLASTSYLTLHFGAQPSVWLAPFAAYLTTLAMAFTETGAYVLRRIAVLAPVATVAAIVVLIEPPATSVWLFAIHVSLVTILMAGWNLRLASMRPEPSQLSSFYVHASLGGLCAAVLVSIGAPLVLNPEIYPAGVVRAVRPILTTGAPEYLICLLAGFVLSARLPIRIVTAVASAAAVIAGVVRFDATSDIVHWSRSEFGQLAVIENETTRSITNGIVLHGYQNARCAAGSEPLGCVEPQAYYGRMGPVGATVASVRQQTVVLRMTVVGLGVGTMGAYCEEGDRLAFFELDPRVLDLADRHFSFLKRARERCRSVQVSIGDGRLLAHEASAASSDLIVLDAFSSDTVPMHLLTAEGLASFARLLSDNGAILVHVSNRYFDLVPVVGAGVRASGLNAIAAIDPGAPQRLSSTWVLASRNQAVVDQAGERLRKAAIDVRPIAGDTMPWTDERHSLLNALRK